MKNYVLINEELKDNSSRYDICYLITKMGEKEKKETKWLKQAKQLIAHSMWKMVCAVFDILATYETLLRAPADLRSIALSFKYVLSQKLQSIEIMWSSALSTSVNHHILCSYRTYNKICWEATIRTLALGVRMVFCFFFLEEGRSFCYCCCCNIQCETFVRNAFEMSHHMPDI